MDWDTLQRVIADWIPFDTTGRLLLAALAGALLGWERELRDKPAGLRTHMLVALGSAVCLVGSLEFAETHPDQEAARLFDPYRVVQGVIGGIGFLGAGVILQSPTEVRGITTAATIWMSAAIGIACGLGLFRLAFTSGIIALGILTMLGRFERRLSGRDPSPQEKVSGG